MPDHDRKLLRLAVVAALKNQITGVDDRVFNSRRVPLEPESLPAILVYTNSESVEERTVAPREYERTVELVIAILEKEDDAFDDVALQDKLDDLAAEVEAVVESDPSFSCGAAESVLTNSRYDENRDGEALIGANRLEYAAKYYTSAQATLDAFERATSDIDVAPPDGQNEIESEFELDQP